MSFTAISCTNNDYLPSENEPQGSIVVLQERDPSLPSKAINRPVVLERKQSRETNENGAIIGNSDMLLGYSYKAGNAVLGDYDNVMSPVVDVEKVKSHDKDYVTPKAIQKYTAERFSYSDYDSYASYLAESKKIKTGFTLNLGLFKLGRQKTTTQTFKSEITSRSNAVYGELNMEYRNSSFNLQASEGSRKFYARECMSSVFLKNLYSSTIGDILNTYGEYILTGYITGGKAHALFAGLGRSGSNFTANGEGMNLDIDASYTWKDGSNSASGDCHFGNRDSSSTSIEYKTDKLQTKLLIYGGKPMGLSMNSAIELSKVSFDLNPWVSSLSDSKLHTIIDITENGLYPLSDFVLEENFKERIESTMEGYISKYPTFVTPYIEIMRVFERFAASGEALYDIAAVLNTRQGDKIVLRSGSTSSASDEELKRNESSTVFNQKASEIKQEKAKYYGLDIKSNSATRLNPTIGNPFVCIDLKSVSEPDMYTYTNPSTGIQYIYYTKAKIAFAHYIDKLDGDWILDDYGIRDWVESLPVKSISMATLANSYKIIGL